jgi:hypothetical protein
MPLIEDANPEKVNTRLQPLFPELVTSFLRLSPESKAVAEEIVRKRGIRFELDFGTDEFLFSAGAFQTASGPVMQRLCVGLKAMERAWALVFGYHTLTRWLIECQNAVIQKRPAATPVALPEAFDLIEWALPKEDPENPGTPLIVPYPPDLPSPSTPHSDAGLMQEVAAASIRTIGWILLHELGHFDKGHIDRPIGAPHDLHAEEYEADEWATATATTPFNSAHSRANLTAVPYGMGIIAAINYAENDDHPSLVSRLKRFASTHIENLLPHEKALYNNVIFNCMSPLQALLFLKTRGVLAEPPPNSKSLSKYLEWWELEFSKK